MEVELSGRKYPVQLPWNGNPLASSGGFPFLGIDTEYTPTIPHQLALIGVSNGKEVALLPPERLPELLDAHPGVVWVCHSCTADWPIILDHLPPASQDAWVQVVDEGRLRDTMLLDMLIRLALDDVPTRADDAENAAPVPPRRLSAVAADMIGTSKDDDDPYRLRFGEIIGQDWNTVDQGFFRYAAKDPLITLLVYLEQIQVAETIMEEFRGDRKRTEIRPDALQRWGHLSEVIQVQGAIALHYVTQRGLGVDRIRLNTTKAELTSALKTMEEYFLAEHPDVVPSRHGPRSKKHTPGEPKRTETGAMSLTNLIGKLTGIAERLKLSEVPISHGKTRALSRSTKDWAKYASQDPFINTWVNYVAKVKLLGFVDSIKDTDRIYPRYNTLVKTGRTSCYGPNLQQQPKGEWRRHFVPTTGYRLFVGDLAGAELCTFAAYCRWAYGFSVMGDQLAAGRNVHGFFAAKILGKSYEDFMAMKQSDPKKFAELRQIAKPANFGLMGGMGALSFAEYASKPPYNVPMTEAKANQLIRIWEDTFPEGQLHRSQFPDLRCLARNLGCKIHEVENWLADKKPWYLYVVERVVAGETKNKQGEPYSPWLVSEIKKQIACLVKKDSLAKLVRDAAFSPALRSQIFQRDVAIVTGRVVGNVRYTDLRNYPFQGLAADIKQALWKLHRAGHRVVGFIHDELLVEVKDEEEGKRVASIIEKTMESLCGKDVPFTVEWHLSDCWIKP